MGFFTLELARRVGTSGRVVAVDIQPKMLDGLRRRLRKAGLLVRVQTRLAQPAGMGVADLAGDVDFALVFAVVHEVPDQSRFFAEIAEALKPGGSVLLVEPAGHVKTPEFETQLRAAAQAGLRVSERPLLRRSHAVLLAKQGDGHPPPAGVEL